MSDSLKKKIINIVVLLVALPCFEVVKKVLVYTSDFSSVIEVILVVVITVLIYTILLVGSIFIVNILITIFMIFGCKAKKQKITDIYLMPFYYDKRVKKLSIKGLTYFSSNYVIYEIRDILTIEQYETLKSSIKKRNRSIILLLLLIIVAIFGVGYIFENIYLGILAIAMILQLLVQSRFHLRYHCRGISTIVDDAYMLQFISNQLQYQNFHLSRDVIYYVKDKIEAIEIYRFYIDIFEVLLIKKGVIDQQDKFIETEIGKLMRENCYNDYRYPTGKGARIGDFYSHFFEHRYLYMLYIIRNRGDYLKRTKDFIEKHIELINDHQENAKDPYVKQLVAEFEKFEVEYISYYEGTFIFPKAENDVSVCNSYRKKMEDNFLHTIVYPEM